MDKSLSKRQTQMLSYIRDHIQRKRFPPSVRDIQENCSVSSTSVVDYNLDRLVEKGYIERDQYVSRGIRLVETEAFDSHGVRTVALDGYIERGRPPAEDAPKGITVDLPMSIVGGHGRVRVMEVCSGPIPEALAAEGDLLVVQDDIEPAHGDTVVAWIESREETVIRRYYSDGVTVRLEALDPSYKAFTALASDVRVTGKVVGMLRAY